MSQALDLVSLPCELQLLIVSCLKLSLSVLLVNKFFYHELVKYWSKGNRIVWRVNDVYNYNMRELAVYYYNSDDDFGSEDEERDGLEPEENTPLSNFDVNWSNIVAFEDGGEACLVSKCAPDCVIDAVSMHRNQERLEMLLVELCAAKNITFVESLLLHRVNPNAITSTPTLCRFGDKDGDRYFNHFATAMSIAAATDDVQMVQLLLKHGAWVADEGYMYDHWTPLAIACSKHNEDMMRLLIEHSALEWYSQSSFLYNGWNVANVVFDLFLQDYHTDVVCSLLKMMPPRYLKSTDIVEMIHCVEHSYSYCGHRKDILRTLETMLADQSVVE